MRNWNESFRAQEVDPLHTLLRTTTNSIRQAYNRHPENRELYNLWSTLLAQLRQRSRHFNIQVAKKRISAGVTGMKARNEAARLRYRPGGNVHVRNAAEMGVNIKNRRPPNVRNLTKTIRSGQLARPSLFSQLFNGRRSKLLWTKNVR